MYDVSIFTMHIQHYENIRVSEQMKKKEIRIYPLCVKWLMTSCSKTCDASWDKYRLTTLEIPNFDTLSICSFHILKL